MESNFQPGYSDTNLPKRITYTKYDDCDYNHDIVTGNVTWFDKDKAKRFSDEQLIEWLSDNELEVKFEHDGLDNHEWLEFFKSTSPIETTTF
jgi:hypothetical protein